MTRAHDSNPMRLRREQLGMQVTELAGKLGRTAAFVSMTEHGYVPTQPARRQQIADALDTTPETLWPQEYAS